jgi:hypothetical protein
VTQVHRASTTRTRPYRASTVPTIPHPASTTPSQPHRAYKIRCRLDHIVLPQRLPLDHDHMIRAMWTRLHHDADSTTPVSPRDIHVRHNSREVHLYCVAFAALALATDPASNSLLDRKPDTCGTRFFTADMIEMTIGQSIYQVAFPWPFDPRFGSHDRGRQDGCDPRVQHLCGSPRSSTLSIAGGSTTSSTSLRVFSTVGISSWQP